MARKRRLTNRDEAQRKADAGAKRVRQYQFAAIPPPTTNAIAQVMTPHGPLTLTDRDLVFQPNDGTPMFVIPRSHIANIEHVIGNRSLFDWHAVMRLTFYTRGGPYLRLDGIEVPPARQFLAALGIQA